MDELHYPLNIPLNLPASDSVMLMDDLRYVPPERRLMIVQVEKEVCLSISNHHEELWSPSWGGNRLKGLWLMCSSYCIDGINWVSAVERYVPSGTYVDVSQRSYWRCRFHTGREKKDIWVVRKVVRILLMAGLASIFVRYARWRISSYYLIQNLVQQAQSQQNRLWHYHLDIKKIKIRPLKVHQVLLYSRHCGS